MAAWQRKSIQSNQTLGERLRAVRLARGRELAAVARRLTIRQDYLDALEHGDYGSLPGEIYIRNFLKAYAIYLELNPVSVLSLYEKEKSILQGGGHSPRIIRAPRGVSRWRFFSLASIARRAVLFPVLAVILLYLGLQVRDILTPPTLSVFEPQDNLVTDQVTVTIRGQSEPSTATTINGQSVSASADGSFSESITLHNGLNIVQIASAKEHSREAVVLRRILVESPAATASLSEATVPLSGTAFK